MSSGFTQTLAAAVEAAWPKAQARWSPFLLLGAPVHKIKDLELAAIDLGTRQIALNGETISACDLEACVEALLAHEIGHHVRWPGSLLVSARLQLIERQLIPVDGYNFANLFTDLLINAELAEAGLRDDLVRIYQAFQTRPGWGRDRAFSFYMAVYEELWRLPPGTLQGAQVALELAQHHPHHRADASVLAQDLFRVGPNVYTQFLFFLSVMARYVRIPEDDKPAHNGDPLRCGHGTPSPDDWAEALTPTASEKEAVARARAEGWLSAKEADRLVDGSAVERRIASLPGNQRGVAEEMSEIMAGFYRREAERHLITPPAQLVLGDAIVPTTLDEWDSGHGLGEIDWVATLRLRGVQLGGIAPLRRERIAEHEGADTPFWRRKLEIYLDVSGSMPDPRSSINAMTLAALVLSSGAIRAGGSVRSLLYSTGHVEYWDWCRSELEMARFLMHYIGGGTDFPFEVLRRSVAEHEAHPPVRVVITDRDFDHNYDAKPQHAALFAEAVRRSDPLVLLLHAPDDARASRYVRAGARVVAVQELSDFPATAAALGRALFEPRAA